jgi:hypothetical protein
MGARQKLNQSHFNWSLFLAATLGVAARSFLLFAAVLITMLATGVHAGDVRMNGRSSRSGRQRKR